MPVIIWPDFHDTYSRLYFVHTYTYNRACTAHDIKKVAASGGYGRGSSSSSGSRMISELGSVMRITSRRRIKYPTVAVGRDTSTITESIFPPP